ncbi:hypothetical protein DQ04_02541060 [Trypanosoma grayi]|uniref:hypothetical protein n=1 Tax=Trypanosoma grayi TaxID=71804 RepID=UPI0004F4B416|nr:hypothetical protein DQ04_02541060 [Trypanosoma grayi]KEG11517.1 hypothetical protein DQ04_02541060 [Trypanosoma grayi]
MRPLRVPLATLARLARFYAGAAPTPEAGASVGRGFKGPQNIGPGRSGPQHQQANPYKSWEHMNHKWLIMMCVGCLAGGIAAGQVVEVDERELRPPFLKEAVLADVAKTFDFRPDLAATGIRVAFILAARRAGLAVDSIDDSCAVASGLEDIAGVLRHLSTVYSISTEDAASLVALAAVKYLQGPCETIGTVWRWGRNDTDEAPPRKKGASDSSCATLPAFLERLGGLTDAECVALMACHSVGEFHEHVSGLDGLSHIGSRYNLSNEYYKFLLANEKKFVEFEVPRTEENKSIQHLPKDFVCVYAPTAKKGKKQQCVFNRREVDAMLQNKTWRKFVEQYAVDEAAWSQAFQSAFTKMIDGNFKRLRPYGTSAE